MAIVKKVAQASKVAPKVAQKVAQKATPVDLIEGAEVLDMESGDIEFLGKEGGRQASPEVEALRDKANSLKIGQGFVIPKALMIEREVTNGKTGASSTIYTYKGANTISKMAKKTDKRFRTRRDVHGKMYLFRVTPLEVVEEGAEGEEGAE